jgi:hypothetical protein
LDASSGGRSALAASAASGEHGIGLRLELSSGLACCAAAFPTMPEKPQKCARTPIPFSSSPIAGESGRPVMSHLKALATVGR